jgi:hypothetical protein
VKALAEQENRFNQLMFGSPRKKEEKGDTLPQASSTDTDWNQLMNHFEEISASIQKLKPVMKELSPLLDFFQKKNN